MTHRNVLKYLAGSALLGMALLAGCKSEADKALDQAKAQAASTNTAQAGGHHRQS